MQIRCMHPDICARGILAINIGIFWSWYLSRMVMLKNVALELGCCVIDPQTESL